MWDEVGKALKIPGVAELVSESFAQFRKLTCCAITSTQVFDDFRMAAGKDRIMGSMNQLMVFRMRNASDEANLAKDARLTDTAREAIAGFPLPHQMANPHSRCFFQFDSGMETEGGVVVNFANSEVVYAAASSGKGYGERVKEHREKGYPNRMAAVMRESSLGATT